MAFHGISGVFRVVPGVFREFQEHFARIPAFRGVPCGFKGFQRLLRSGALRACWDFQGFLGVFQGCYRGLRGFKGHSRLF